MATYVRNNNLHTLPGPGFKKGITATSA